MKKFVILEKLTLLRTAAILYNQLGETVKVFNFERASDAQPLDIDLSGIDNGLYFLQINEENARPVTKRIVVAKDY